MTAAPFQPVTAFLIVMNLAVPTDGFECSVSMTGAPHFVLSTTYNTLCGVEPISGAPQFYECFGTSDFPVPANGAVVLVTWSILLTASMELQFHIGGYSVPSLPAGLPVLVGDGVARFGGVASGDVNLPVAALNAGNCPVSAEVSAFGAVKGLFR
ncbi:MAG: hypothetical protein IPK64_18060 [bacterium]|nr:hypothetical protein [bacterium]